MNTTTLTSQARSALRAAAHPLKPVILIGDQGLTDSVLKEIDVALKAHELIKIRAAGQDREERDEMLTKICETLACERVHHIGKTLIVYRLGNQGRYVAEPSKAKATVARKKDLPHTPKKMAAEGITLDKPSRSTRRPAKTEAQDDVRVFSSERPPRPTSRPKRAVKKTASRGIRKSALSLRAGARRR